MVSENYRKKEENEEKKEDEIGLISSIYSMYLTQIERKRKNEESNRINLQI